MRNGVKVRLTPTESRLLHLLLTHSGQVLTTDVIVERVWGYDDAGDTGLVKTHIRHLRQKVEPEPNAPQFIVTVPGVGYTFMAQVPVVSTPSRSGLRPLAARGAARGRAASSCSGTADTWEGIIGTRQMSLCSDRTDPAHPGAVS